MFCDRCGTPVQTGQGYCSKCGKQIMGPVLLAQPRPGRVQEHVRLLGLFWLALSAFDAVSGVFLYVFANAAMPRMGQFAAPDAPAAFLRPLLSVFAILLLAKAALGLLAGWGLLRREKWARILALVLAFVSLFTNIPFGTALGVYTLWVLLPSESEREYAALSESRAA
jgi:phage shock protein PspC (stress-responsive transcriptional regulator)